MLFLQFLDFCAKWGLWAMILVPDMLAGMSVKGSKDADVRLVSKKSLKQKRLIGLAPRAR